MHLLHKTTPRIVSIYLTLPLDYIGRCYNIHYHTFKRFVVKTRFLWIKLPNNKRRDSSKSAHKVNWIKHKRGNLNFTRKLLSDLK